MRPSKRDELVQKALIIFYQNGFHATGMDMLVKEIGISKTSIYNHFRTKEELILAVLRLRDEQFRHWLFRRMEELANHPREQLIVMFDALGEWFTEPSFKGCMFIKARSEFQDETHPICKHCTEHKWMVERHLSTLAKAAKLAQPEKLASELILLKEGAIVAAQLNINDKPEQLAKEIAKNLVRNASPH